MLCRDFSSTGLSALLLEGTLKIEHSTSKPHGGLKKGWERCLPRCKDSQPFTL
jgi:hypothetical protein